MWNDVYRALGRASGPAAQRITSLAPGRVSVHRPVCAGPMLAQLQAPMPERTPSDFIKEWLHGSAALLAPCLTSRTAASVLPKIHQPLRQFSPPLCPQQHPLLRILSLDHAQPLTQSTPNPAIAAFRSFSPHARFSSSHGQNSTGPGDNGDRLSASSSDASSGAHTSFTSPKPSCFHASPSISPSATKSGDCTEAAASATAPPGTAPAAQRSESGTGPPPAPPAPAPGIRAAEAVLALRAGAVSVGASLERTSTSLWAAAVDLGAKLNQVTGYDTIEQMKRKVDEATRRLADAREDLRNSKATYEARASEQGALQRQQMDLLQRKSSWQAADLERFTELCRQEHRLELQVAQAKAAYTDAAEAVESWHDQVAEAVRERYSAETMWSDKIRRASTWWTAGLMALNLVSFMSVYLVMEPIKARRLRNHVEDVLHRELAYVRQSLASLEAGVKLTNDSPRLDGSLASAAAAVTQGVKAPQGGATQGGMDLPPELLEHVRLVTRHLQALERRLATTPAGRQHDGEHLLAVPALSPSGSPLPLGESLGSAEREAITSDALGEPLSEGTEKGAPAMPAWYRRLGQHLYSVTSTPDFTTATAALIGSVLGVGVLLLLRDR